MGECENPGQRIIDLVSHAGGQTPDRSEFFASSQLLLGGGLAFFFSLGDSFGHVVDGLA